MQGGKRSTRQILREKGMKKLEKKLCKKRECKEGTI